MRPTFYTYRQIADDIEQKISQGTYPPGSKLPSYRQLAGIYHVHPSTVQRAILLLRWNSAVIGSQGRGVFVAEPQPDDRPTPSGRDGR